MPSDGIQDVRFDQINERETGANVIRELNQGPKEFRTRIGRIFSTRNPGAQCRRRYRKITRGFCKAVGGLLFGGVLIEFLFLQSHVTDYALGFYHSQVDFFAGKMARPLVFEAEKRFGLSVLNYVVTSNHVHLLVRDTGSNVIPQSMQLIAGRTAQEYNYRKGRQAFLVPSQGSSSRDAAVRCLLHGLALASCPK